MARRFWVLVALVLVASPAAGAPYLQDGVDAARTWSTDDPGPAWGDVAFRVDLPGSRADGAPPVILGGAVYVLTTDYGFDGLDQDALWRIDLDTAEATEHIPLDDDIRHEGLASDGQRFFVGRTGGFDAFDVATGEPLWSWEHPQLAVSPSAITSCAPPAVAAGVVYAGCWQKTDPGDQYSVPAADAELVPFIGALDAATGEELWFQEIQPWRALGQPDEPGGGSIVPDVPGDPAGAWVVSVSVIGERVLVVTQGRGDTEIRDILWVLDRPSGERLWETSGAQERSDADSDTESDRSPEERVLGFAVPTGRPGVLITKPNELLEVRDEQNRELWEEELLPAEREIASTRLIRSALALSGQDLYATSGAMAYRLDDEGREVEELLELETAPSARPRLTVARDTLYTAYEFSCSSRGPCSDAAPFETLSQVAAYDPATSATLWSTQIATQDLVTLTAILDAVGEGVLAVAGVDGRVTVLGSTAASPEPVVDFASAYPAPEEAVEVDLSGSEAGALGPVTRYRADWGDGTRTDWTNRSTLTHTYNGTDEHEARFHVANDANQTASTVQTFDVGGTPPEEQNFLQTAFADENQDMTFGVLGVVLAIGGTIVGVVARRRHDAAEADRLEAYQRVLGTEIAEGRADQDLTRRMAPMRAALGISEKEHARLVEQLMAQRSGTAVALVPGETFLGRYDVLERLGGGGGGTAYLCHDQRIDREVVIKALHTVGQDVEATVREARAFGAVNHENVVSLHDVEQVGDRVFLVLEHVPGGSLDERDDAPELNVLAEDLLSGLAAVHDAGVVHRDVKPSNLLVTAEGRFKLADFGIAHTPGFQTSVGGLGGGAVGTVQYMSPEQARGREVDHHSDLYSAAVVLWEAITREAYMAPEPGETATELQMRIAQADGLPKVSEDAPEELRVWFEQALAPEPGERFQTAGAMLEAFHGSSRPDR